MRRRDESVMADDMSSEVVCLAAGETGPLSLLWDSVQFHDQRRRECEERSEEERAVLMLREKLMMSLPA